jgi:U3 small nucleolar RNA-associated protein 5
VQSTAIIIEKLTARYKYHTLQYESSDDVLATKTFQVTAAIDEARQGSTKQEGGEVAVLGALEAGGKKRPIVDDAIEGSSTTASNGSSKKAKVAESEMTLEEKLSLLSRSMKDIEDAAAVDDEDNNEDRLTADSLVTLVDQALQSGDDTLLEQCLSCGDLDTIDATAENLPSGRVLLLMRRLVAKFEKRPSRGLLLTRWLSALLRHHLSLLVALPDLSSQLAGLTQMLEQRIRSYTRLAALNGRLDLLLSQSSSSRKPKKKEELAAKTTFVDE